jgi:geranylgeranyl reductase family protein
MSSPHSQHPPNPTSTSYDVAVIGAGPAGSATAYALASRGFKVALIDSAAFPRDKACGDLLSPSAVLSLYQLGLSSFIDAHRPEPAWQAALDLMGHHIPYRINTEWPEGRAKWMTIRRLDLDAALAEHARQAGAELLERVRVSGLETSDGLVEIQAQGIDGGKLSARMTVIATGSGGNLARGTARFLAVRGYYSGAPGEDMAIRWNDEVLPGYVWQFPTTTPGVYNVGIYTHHDKARELGLLQQMEKMPLTADKELLGPLKGGLLDVSYATHRLAAHADRTLWVGDAAGLVQPHLGEGIGPALRSALIAAEIAESALNSDDLGAATLVQYTSRLSEEFEKELRFSRIFYWIARRPRLFKVSARFLRRFYSLAHRSIIGAPPAPNASVKTPDELLA